MNIYIFADIEGISGVYSREQVIPGERRFNEGRDYMTADINACARGAKAGGAEKVFVRDGHGGGYSVRWEGLCDAVDEVLCGDSDGNRFPFIEETDGLILLGYHAMAGTAGAVLEHSMNSKRIQNYWINGQKAGETAIDAGIAGEHHIPVIMVSGDDKVCAEAKALLPWIKTAQVKRSTATYGSVLLNAEKAHQLLYDTAKEAVEDLSSMKTLVYEKPVRFRIEVMERCPLPNPHSQDRLTIIDGRTYEIEADSMEDALYRS